MAITRRGVVHSLRTKIDSVNVTATLDSGREQRAQVTLALCFLTAVIEGLDLQSMGIAAPSLGPEFGLSRQQLGVVLLASPLGLFFGAFIGGRLADSWGRKKALVLAMALFGALQLCTAWATGLESLLGIRFLCGLGLGGAFPNLIALTAEASGGRNSIINVVITVAGMPAGGALASLIGFLAGANGDWRIVFYVGGIAPLALAPVMALALPESALFRAAKAAAAAAGTKHTTLEVLFGRTRAGPTVLLWVAVFFTTLVTYLLLNWMPVLMGAKGFSRTDSLLIQILFNVGAALGSVYLGWRMQRRPRRTVLLVCYAGLAAGLVVMAPLGKASRCRDRRRRRRLRSRRSVHSLRARSDVLRRRDSRNRNRRHRGCQPARLGRRAFFRGNFAGTRCERDARASGPSSCDGSGRRCGDRALISQACR
jgi:AAHS family 3-hydroxyphenylpropionic acid transporter